MSNLPQVWNTSLKRPLIFVRENENRNVVKTSKE